jgi:hypothetical protein
VPGDVAKQSRAVQADRRGAGQLDNAAVHYAVRGRREWLAVRAVVHRLQRLERTTAAAEQSFVLVVMPAGYAEHDADVLNRVDVLLKNSRSAVQLVVVDHDGALRHPGAAT